MQVKVSWEGGSSSSKEHSTSESGNKHDTSANNDIGDDSSDDYSDAELEELLRRDEELLKQFGGTSNDVKEFQVDLDFTKP